MTALVRTWCPPGPSSHPGACRRLSPDVSISGTQCWQTLATWTLEALGGLRAMAHRKDSHAHSSKSSPQPAQVARLDADAATLHTNVRSMFGLQVAELVGLQPCCLDSPHHPHELDVCTPASSPLNICLDLSLHLPPKAGKQRGWCHCRCLLHLFDCVYFPFLFLLLLLLLLVHHSAQAVSIRMADES